MFLVLVALFGLVHSSYEIDSINYGKGDIESFERSFQKNGNVILLPIKFLSADGLKPDGYARGSSIIDNGKAEGLTDKGSGSIQQSSGFGDGLTININTGKDSGNYNNPKSENYGKEQKHSRSYIFGSDKYDVNANNFGGSNSRGYDRGNSANYDGNVRNYGKASNGYYHRHSGNYGKGSTVPLSKNFDSRYADNRQKPITYGSSSSVDNYDGTAYGGVSGDYGGRISDGYKKGSSKSFENLKILRDYGGPKNYGGKPGNYGGKAFIVSYNKRYPNNEGSSFIDGNTGYGDGSISSYGNDKTDIYDKESANDYRGGNSDYGKVVNNNYGGGNSDSFSKISTNFNGNRESYSKGNFNNYGGENHNSYGKATSNNYGTAVVDAYSNEGAGNYGRIHGGHGKASSNNYKENTENYARDNVPFGDGNYGSLEIEAPNVFGKEDSKYTDGTRSFVPIIIRLQSPNKEGYETRGSEQYNSNSNVQYGSKLSNNYENRPIVENYGEKPTKPSEGKKFGVGYSTSSSQYGRIPVENHEDKSSGFNLGSNTDIFNLDLGSLLGIKLP